jgi:hypothetical protein
MTEGSSWMDEQMESVLTETIDMIPILYAEDPEMKMRLLYSVADMRAYVRKMWVALGAESAVGYAQLNAWVVNSFVTFNPKTVLECKTMAEFLSKLLPWVEKALDVEFTPEEIRGKESLEIIGQSLSKVLTPHLGKLKHGQ